MIPSKNHGPTTPIHPKTNTRNTVKCVCEMKSSPLKTKRLADDCRLVSMAVPQERRTERRKRRVFSNETLVYRRGGDDHHRRSREYFLERSCVVIGVTVCENDPHDGAGPYALAFQCGRRIGRGVDHDAAAVDPEDVSRSGSAFIKPVRISQDGDSKGRRMEGRRKDHGVRGASVICPAGLVFIQTDDADALRDAYVSGKTSFAHDDVVFVNVVHDVIRSARHFKNLDAFGFILGDLVLRSIRGIYFCNVS